MTQNASALQSDAPPSTALHFKARVATGRVHLEFWLKRTIPNTRGFHMAPLTRVNELREDASEKMLPQRRYKKFSLEELGLEQSCVGCWSVPFSVTWNKLCYDLETSFSKKFFEYSKLLKREKPRVQIQFI